MKSMLTAGFFTAPFLHGLLCLLIILSTFTVTYSQYTAATATQVITSNDIRRGGASSPSARLMLRNIYGKITCQL